MNAAAGLRLAVSWLTVVPMPTDRVDRDVGGRAISLSPVIGAGLGLVGTGLGYGLTTLGANPLLAALLVVGACAWLTRGMHLDGLADVADGLGCYGPPERALTVMRDGAAGPFAVVTLILVVGAQVIALSQVMADHRWWVLVLAVTTGRAAFTWCCLRGIGPARPDGLGRLVAGTQPVWIPLGWFAILAGAAVFVVPGRWWLGPLAVLAALAVVIGLSRRTNRRFGGLTGDVLGAASELATTAVLIVCSLSLSH